MKIKKLNWILLIGLFVYGGLGTTFHVKGFVPHEFGLIAYYPFDKDANDYSGNGNDGIIHNSTFNNGILGGSIKFTGNLNSYDEIKNSNSLNVSEGVTISLWFNETSLSPAYSSLVYKAGEQPTSNGFKDRVYTLWTRSDQGIHFTSTPDNATSQIICNTPSGVYRENTFFHIVGRINATNKTMSIFINGSKITECSYGNKIRSGNYPLRIGGPFRTLSDQFGFNGSIDEVRIYNRSLSDSEIKKLYISGIIW